MKMGNRTVISEFILLGLPIDPDQRDLFYALFLAMYVTTILGNLLIIVLIHLDSHLHTPICLSCLSTSFNSTRSKECANQVGLYHNIPISS